MSRIFDALWAARVKARHLKFKSKEPTTLIEGSIVGTRKDSQGALMFAAGGKVKSTIETTPLESMNGVFENTGTEKFRAA